MLDAATGVGGGPWPQETTAVGVARQLALQAAGPRRLPQGRVLRRFGLTLAAAAYATLATVIWAAHDPLGRLERPLLVKAPPTALVPGAAGAAGSVADLAPAFDGEPVLRAMAALEASRATFRSLPSEAPPALSMVRFPADPSEDADAGRPPTTTDRQPAPPTPARQPEPTIPAAPSLAMASVPLPSFKPLDAAAVVTAATTTAAPPAPAVNAADRGPDTAASFMPALKPVGRSRLATDPAGSDACAVATMVGRRGALPDGCGVRLAEARDQGVLRSFWSSLKDFLASGARSTLVAANDGGRDRSRSGVGSDRSGEAGEVADQSGAGAADGNSAGGGAAGGSSAGGGAAGGNSAGGGAAGGGSAGGGAAGGRGAAGRRRQRGWRRGRRHRRG